MILNNLFIPIYLPTNLITFLFMIKLGSIGCLSKKINRYAQVYAVWIMIMKSLIYKSTKCIDCRKARTTKTKSWLYLIILVRSLILISSTFLYFFFTVAYLNKKISNWIFMRKYAPPALCRTSIHFLCLSNAFRLMPNKKNKWKIWLMEKIINSIRYLVS